MDSVAWTRLLTPTAPEEEKVLVRSNITFRTEFHTNSEFQYTAMTINETTMGDLKVKPPKPSIGWERHPETIQYMAVEMGEGTLLRAPPGQPDRNKAERLPFKEGEKVFINKGWWHDVETDKEIKIFVTYIGKIPHKPGTVHWTRVQAEAEEDDH